MNKRGVPRLVQAVAMLLILLCAARAAGAEIVVVRTSDAEPYTQAEAALRERLTEQHDNTRSVLLKEVAQKGIDAAIGKPDAVVAIGTSSARWLHDHLPASTTLVYCMVSNPAEAGLLQGRSSSGVKTEVGMAEQLRLIGEALPHARSIGMLYRSDTADGKSALQSLVNSMPNGWNIESVAANDYPSIAEAIDALTLKKVDLIWTTADQKLYDTAAVRTLLLAALRAKIPVWGFSTAFVRAGALIGVGVEPRAQGIQAAALVMNAMEDPRKAAAGPEAPKEFQIALNLVVAQQLGIEIPESLTRRATYVYRPEK